MDINETIELRGILIDPSRQSIKEVRVRKGYNSDIYNHIGADRFECVSFIPRLVNGKPKPHTIFVDEEGLFKNDPFFFFNKFTRQSLAGKSLILGFNEEEGTSENCLWTIDGINKNIKFLGDRTSVKVLLDLGLLRSA